MALLRQWSVDGVLNAHLRFEGCEPIGGNTTIVSATPDLWLPSQLALVPN